MKRFICSLCIFLAASTLTFAKSKKSKEFHDISSEELVLKMETGWNLGNTLDANASADLSSETSWGQPQTTKEMIDGIAAAGFKTIRIPVSWSNHLEAKNRIIDPKWMKRVKEIVDWAIEDGLFVIINIHHDNYSSPSGISYGDGFYPNMVCWNESMLFIKSVWSQISKTFNNDYDEHLIFEVMNEPRLRGHAHEWWVSAGCNDCKYGVQVLNKLNQLAVDTIRSSGGNNEKRFIMIPGIAASPHSVLDSAAFKMPDDNLSHGKKQRLILSVHMYTPYSFAMEAPGDLTFEKKHKSEIDGTFADLNEKYIQKGIPVVIGEYGATNKNNLEERVKWFSYFISQSRRYGMCSILWDNGDANASTAVSEKFGFYNRRECKWYFPEIVEAIVENVMPQ